MSLILVLRAPHGPSTVPDDGGGGGGDPVPVSGTYTPDFFASTSGSAGGDGSQGNPWDLQTVLNGAGGALVGKKVALRGGTYTKAGGVWTVGTGLNGTNPGGHRNPAGKIHIRAYPGERVIISDRMVLDNGHDYWLWDLEVKNTDVSSHDKMGIDVHADRVGLVRIRSYDHSGNAFGMWVEAAEAWAEECRGYNSGFTGSAFPGGESYGHGFYTQNALGNVRIVRNLVTFNNFGYGLHAYAESGGLADFQFRGVFNYYNGRKDGYDFQIGGGTPLTNLIARDLWSHRGSTAGRFGYTDHTDSADFQDCLFDGRVYLWNMSGADLRWHNVDVCAASGDNGLFVMEESASLDTSAWDFAGNRYSKPDGASTAFCVQVNGNQLFYDLAGFKTRIADDADATFTTASNLGARVKVQANAIDSSTATIAIRNPSGASTVSVDLSSVMSSGDHYAIYNDYDWVTPVLSGTYAGGSLSIPMTGKSPPAMLGGSLRSTSPVNGNPQIGTFLLRRS